VAAASPTNRFLKEKPLVAYYDEVLIEGLKLAQADAERGLLDEERMLRVRDAVAEIVDDLGAHEDTAEPEIRLDRDAAAQAPLAQLHKSETMANQSTLPLPERWRTGKPVLCIPGLGLLDEAVALMVAQLVEREGIGARAEQADALSMSRIFSLDTNAVELICLCYVENATSAQIRYAVRRLRRKAPKAFILVSLAGVADNVDDQTFREFANVECVRQSLAGTVQRILEESSAGAESEHVPRAEPSPNAMTA
jgi:hypothetical protein